MLRLSCARCGRNRPPGEPANVCECGSPLLVDYDLDAVAAATSPAEIARRAPTMWRYGELLPVGDPGHVVSLGEGFTRLAPLPEVGRRIGLPDLWLKDEGPNPTGTFKARGASAGISMARELGIHKMALPTAGNAGGAWACYGAAAGVRVRVAMPSDAPELNLLECRLHGAEVLTVEGLISDAARAIAEDVRQGGWFDAGTLREPYRIEGKKTLGLEIAEQFGWRAPDAIVYPAGGGVGIIGIWRALMQISQLGWLQGDMPRHIVTQAEGCAPLVRAFEDGLDESAVWQDPHTLAHGLRVPKAFGDFLVLRAVRETGGTAIAVSDEAILGSMSELGRAGVSACPEGAATLAAAAALRERGDLLEGDRVVLVNTGSALKYPEALRRLATA